MDYILEQLDYSEVENDFVFPESCNTFYDRALYISDYKRFTSLPTRDKIHSYTSHYSPDIYFLEYNMKIEGNETEIKAMQEKHPDVQIYCAKIDDHLNENAYIVPGLGDAGDRIFGTK